MLRPAVVAALALGTACFEPPRLAASPDGGPVVDAADAGDGAPDAGAPAVDTQVPWPIDREEAGAPQTYKGLALRLTDNGAPQVTPVRGVIGVVCVGMSNGVQECEDFIQKLRGPMGAEVSTAVRVVNCAVGGNAIERWIDPANDATLWDRCISMRLPAAGLGVDQVRVLWHKAADQFTLLGDTVRPPYPDPEADYFRFLGHLDLFAARVPEKFPAAQAVYTTSRSFGGFATQASRGEPLSYEEGHALNQWLSAHALLEGVWFGWGPYLWAPQCGTGVTNGSGVCYERSDYQLDGVHPAQGAKDKVSAMLHARFLEHPWYRR